MAATAYDVVELVRTGPGSWGQAAEAAVTAASKSLRELRIAEVMELDVQLDHGAIRAYGAERTLSFKYESAD